MRQVIFVTAHDRYALQTFEVHALDCLLKPFDDTRLRRAIDWIEAAGNYLEIHAAGRTHLIRDTLKDMEARLDPERFVRVHRSRLMNRDRVRHVEAGAFGEFVLTLDGGATRRSGRGYGDRIRQWLQRAG